MKPYLMTNYRVQEDVKCCQNCAQHDTAVDMEEHKYLLCTIFNDPVDPLGVCDGFE